MGLRQRFANWLLKSTSTASNPRAWFIDWVQGGMKSATGISINQISAMRAATVMACVSIRAVDMAKLPVHVYRAKPKGGQEILENHPLERILRRPNEWQTRLEFIEQMQTALLLKSNAYALIQRNGRSQPTALFPAQPDNVTLFESPEGSLFYEVNAVSDHDRAILRQFPRRIPAEDMLHVRWLSLNGLMGLSRISLLKEAIGLNLAQERTAAMLFGNGATPSFALKTDKRLSKDTFDRMKTQIRSHMQGLDNVGEIMLLEEGLAPETVQMTMVDSDFINGRKFQVEEIARAFDVPPHRLGITPQGGGAAILQANQMYLNNTVSSDAERWESKLNHVFDLDGEREYVEFDLDYFNRADVQTRMTAYRTGIVGMVYAPNEARRKEGLEDKEHGDVLYQPTNVAEIGFEPAGKETGPGSDTTGEPAPGGDGDPSAVQDSGKQLSNGHLKH